MTSDQKLTFRVFHEGGSTDVEAANADVARRFVRVLGLSVTKVKLIQPSEGVDTQGRTVSLKAYPVPYSSVVGGGLMLQSADTGQVLFTISFRGTIGGITKDETTALVNGLASLISKHGLEVPAR